MKKYMLLAGSITVFVIGLLLADDMTAHLSSSLTLLWIGLSVR